MLTPLLLAACTPEVADTAADCDLATVPGPIALENVISGTASDCEVAFYLDMLDERGENEGPWFEDMFVTHTADALSIDVEAATPLMTSAAVPEIVRGDDGRYYLFYGEGDLDLGRQVAASGSDWFSTHGLIGYGALGLAVSDDGVTFEPVEEFEVVEIVRGMVVDPDVVRLPDGSYRMYYVGVPVPELVEADAWADGAAHTIFSATSADLIHWVQEGEAVTGPNADPSVFCFSADNCIMASTGIDWSASADGGQTFAFTASEEPFGFAPEFFLLPDGGLRMFYNSRTSGGALMSMLSYDGGQHWTDEGERVGVQQVEAVSLAPAPQGGWLVYYHYWQEGYSGDYWGGNE